MAVGVERDVSEARAGEFEVSQCPLGNLSRVGFRLVGESRKRKDAMWEKEGQVCSGQSSTPVCHSGLEPKH